MAEESNQSISCSIEGGRLRFGAHLIHPMVLRDRSTSTAHVDPTNRQRLWEPLDAPTDLALVAVEDLGTTISFHFNDGQRAEMCTSEVTRLGDCQASLSVDVPIPRPLPWTAEGMSVPTFPFGRLVDPATSDEAVVEALAMFYELGCLVLTDTPAEPSALHEITRPFGRISPTNFGALFDVRTEPRPIDLAYTPVALSAHTDQPYRTPVPGIQFLHAIVNDAPGGASTMVDGLAAADALAAADPEAHDVLTTLAIEFRYDIGSDVKVAIAPLIERARDGTLRQIRFSPRLDFAPPVDPDLLDIYYRGRRWLASALNDPARQLNHRLRSGEVLIVDNHRVLHGRTAFDPHRGSRHLQGCYIDHDGPATAWMLAHRRLDERKHHLR